MSQELVLQRLFKFYQTRRAFSRKTVSHGHIDTAVPLHICCPLNQSVQTCHREGLVPGGLITRHAHLTCINSRSESQATKEMQTLS